MNNYEKMQEAARLHFLEYDFDVLVRRTPAQIGKRGLTFSFLGQTCDVDRATGEIFIDAVTANFSQSLTVYDWLCDRRPDAAAANEFCTVHSLPGVLVSGGTLGLNGNSVAPLIAKKPDKFLEICGCMDGKQVAGADLAVIIRAFPDLPVLLKFYYADEEFPPSLSLLWDRNILQFIRYETVYYLAGCLLNRIREGLEA